MAKREGQQLDTLPVQMYVKDGNDVSALSIVNGAFLITDKNGMLIPRHDKQVIDESGVSVVITYSYKGTDVAVKTISTSGKITTISIAYE